MKKVFYVIVIMYSLNFTYAQASKFYLATGAGIAFPGGDTSDNLKTGLDLSFINVGYRFSENWGTTLSWGGSKFAITSLNDTFFDAGYFAIGPMYTLPIYKKLSIDIKPQYVLSLAEQFEGKEANNFDDGYGDIILSGSGFLIGNSIVYSITNKINWSLNIDYLTGKFVKPKSYLDQTNSRKNRFSKFSIGFGVRYNFYKK